MAHGFGGSRTKRKEIFIAFFAKKAAILSTKKHPRLKLLHSSIFGRNFSDKRQK
jgi:hypothetical protein